jgi:hypothetical protein
VPTNWRNSLYRLGVENTFKHPWEEHLVQTKQDRQVDAPNQNFGKDLKG